MKTGNKLLIAFFIILDLAIAGFLVYTVNRDDLPASDRRDALAVWIGDTGSLTPEAREELYSRKTGEALALTYVQGECEAKNGRANLRFSNGEKSECAVSLELVELDSGTTLARTDLLDPGYRLEGLDLVRLLSPGDYQCLAKLDFYWMVNDAYVGSAARQVLLTVH